MQDSGPAADTIAAVSGLLLLLEEKSHASPDPSVHPAADRRVAFRLRRCRYHDRRVRGRLGVTTKVKAKLVEDPVTSAWDIRVTTVSGTVQLSGFVKSDREKERAGELARAVPGVKSVVNDVIVK